MEEGITRIVENVWLWWGIVIVLIIIVSRV